MIDFEIEKLLWDVIARRMIKIVRPYMRGSDSNEKIFTEEMKFAQALYILELQRMYNLNENEKKKEIKQMKKEYVGGKL